MSLRYEVSWFSDFTCLAGDCPYTCCKGWVIPLSDRDIERLAKERGVIRLMLFFATKGWTSSRFNTDSGACPFLGCDGLCRLQKKNGHDFIPWTCQSYPRFYRNYGSFEEACLDLSCPGAARLFIEKCGDTDTLSYESEPVTKLCTTNDDQEYLDLLLLQRKEMMDTVREVFGKDLPPKEHISLCQALTNTLFSYAAGCQAFYAGCSNGGHYDLSFDDFYKSGHDSGRDSASTFPLSEDILLKILDSSLCHPRLRKVTPKLYRMFKRSKTYLKRCRLRKISYIEKASSYLCENPDFLRILGAYLSYYLFQYYLRTFETYSFRRQVALGLCHMNMVLLLAITSNSPLTDDSVSHIISVYNRRAYFNDDILDEMYRIFESGFDLK